MLSIQNGSESDDTGESTVGMSLIYRLTTIPFVLLTKEHNMFTTLKATILFSFYALHFPFKICCVITDDRSSCRFSDDEEVSECMFVYHNASYNCE